MRVTESKLKTIFFGFTITIFGLILYTFVLLFQKRQLQKELIDTKLKCIETMSDLSYCYSEHANTTHSYSKCEDSLYDLREWIRWCKPKCQAETGFRKVLEDKEI
jgi:hypothetical protein